jgi:hypothetical protein
MAPSSSGRWGFLSWRMGGREGGREEGGREEGREGARGKGIGQRSSACSHPPLRLCPLPPSLRPHLKLPPPALFLFLLLLPLLLLFSQRLVRVRKGQREDASRREGGRAGGREGGSQGEREEKAVNRGGKDYK